MAKKHRKDKPDRHTQSLGEQIEEPESQGVRGLDEHTSAKILREARLQQSEVEAEEYPFLASTAGGQGQLESVLEEDSESDGELGGSYAGSLWDEKEVEVSPEDEAAIMAFMSHDAATSQPRNLADIILAKIREKQGDGGLPVLPEEGAAAVAANLDARVAEVYQGVASLMRRYTTGKMPKAFKIIPSLRNWEEILFLTDPEGWSSHAAFQATRLFVSNLNAKMAQRFLALVLLPKVREDIRANRRLHFALFQAMKKAAYKPDAFFKGLLLPLCQAGDCTLREAVIFSSVIKRVSLPVLHSAAALLRIAEMPYAGTNSFFIRVLLDKKYALPYRVVDALVDHFLRFRGEERVLPVVWHQALLCFVQRYKHEIRRSDQEAIRKLLKTQYHYQVTPEIYRELDAARARGEKAPEGVAVAEVLSLTSGHSTENPKDLAPLVFMDQD